MSRRGFHHAKLTAEIWRSGLRCPPRLSVQVVKGELSMPTKTIGETVDTSEWFDNQSAVRNQKKGLPKSFHDAFERMRELGLDTIEGMACCGTCASSDIDGYGAYYHEQDINAFGEMPGSIPETVYIGYNSPTDETLKFAGQVVQAAFEAEGFETDWEGDVSRRVGVEVF